MDDSGIKVTDRRMFTEDGELREDYRDVESVESAESNESVGASAVQEPPRAAEPSRSPTLGKPPSDSDMESGPARPAELMDLVGMLYEQIALAFGDARLPSGESFEDLGRARLYIDLLQVLQEKTRGNLSSEEEALLEDLLYRVQLRFVEKQRGQ